MSPRSPSGNGGGYGRSSGAGSNENRLPDVLQIFTRLEPDGTARRDADFLARAGIAPDAALARLHLEDPESAKLDPFAPLHGHAHRVEHGVHRHLSLDL